jgi:hypothetical protein
MQDVRLLGTWRSDARRTRPEIEARKDVTKKSKNGLRALVGRLELRYTRTACYSKLDDEILRTPYRVVARDANSVAIVYEDPVVGDQISHIHFEGRHFWILVGGKFREFFRRVDKQ